MKKTLSIILSLIMVLCLVACGTSPKETTEPTETTQTEPVEKDLASITLGKYLEGVDLPGLTGDTVSLILGHASTEDSDQHKVVTAFKEALEYLSDGKIKVTIYPNAQLGSDTEMIASCAAGDIDFVYQAGSTHSTLVPETGIFDTPFLFTGVDKMTVREALRKGSEFRKMYDTVNEKAGFKCLTLVSATSMNLTSNKPVYSLKDLKGLKIRTAQAPSRMAIWEACGANPTPLAFSELYMALQNGTVDAQDNVWFNVIVSSAYEVQKYMIPTGHFQPSLEIVMNLSKWNTLPAAYQDLIEKVSDATESYDYDLQWASEERNYNLLKDEYGLEVCELSDEFIADLKEAAVPAINAVKKMVGNDEIYAALDRSLGR